MSSARYSRSPLRLSSSHLPRPGRVGRVLVYSSRNRLHVSIVVHWHVSGDAIVACESVRHRKAFWPAGLCVVQHRDGGKNTCGRTLAQHDSLPRPKARFALWWAPRTPAQPVRPRYPAQDLGVAQLFHSQRSARHTQQALGTAVARQDGLVKRRIAMDAPAANVLVLRLEAHVTA